ncbi:nitroreductase family protein [Bacillus sp. ISL-75]|uniref:nitroreductase family protein n=1 Tax=Bacillus sp. ISL-75 TaxID=2819137 RepID=UPI001BEBE175|nr:nitroreductase family protein [Bacillus sp. ISL-75]MBT2729540.1 nitroreductase family protein [Bacillus sp. ISL-75]
MESTKIFFERQTTNKYLNKPVSKELLIEVLKAASRAPSWANSQPWEIYVAAGEKLEALRSAYLESFQNHEPHTQDLPTPKEWPEYIDNRMKKSFAESFKSMGIVRDDDAERYKNWKNNYQFFGAPVGYTVFWRLSVPKMCYLIFQEFIYAPGRTVAYKSRGVADLI